MFAPGQGAAGQVHDFNPGILGNGLFWTMEIPRSSFEFRSDGSAARLKLSNLPIPDTFFFANNVSVAAEIDVEVMWRAVGLPTTRGEGLASPEPFFTKHLGEFSDAVAEGVAGGAETGFSFRSGPMTSADFYGSIGPQRNGVFL